jgi:hypothetical protein
MAKNAPAKARLQFSLRSMFLATLVVALFLGALKSWPLDHGGLIPGWLISEWLCRRAYATSVAFPVLARAWFCFFLPVTFLILTPAAVIAWTWTKRTIVPGFLLFLVGIVLLLALWLLNHAGVTQAIPDHPCAVITVHSAVLVLVFSLVGAVLDCWRKKLPRSAWLLTFLLAIDVADLYLCWAIVIWSA